MYSKTGDRCPNYMRAKHWATSRTDTDRKKEAKTQRGCTRSTSSSGTDTEKAGKQKSSELEVEGAGEIEGRGRDSGRTAVTAGW